MTPELPPHRYPPVADLAVLVAAVEHGGVGAAARALGMAQPNASRALRRLERMLRLELLTRGPTGAAPTRDGALVVDWARRVLEANQRLLLGAAAIGRGHTGTVRLAASQTIAEELLPRWLAALRAEHPEAEVSLTVGNSQQVGRLLGSGCTLGFVESPELPAGLTVAVDSREVSTDRLVVVVAPGHPWARRTRPVPLDELVGTPLIVREPGSGTRIALERALAGVTMAAPALELASNAAVRVAVIAGAGPAVLSEHAVQAAVSAGELRAVMVDGLVVERPLRAIWPVEPPLPALGVRLVELAVELERTRRAPEPPPRLDPGWGI
ncbi:MAG: LysR substrate-binding domain-containing protein [Micropruina sp.]|uniref:LysR substrate-binding domain-containing protein n=1 Tax=Micropruina sp. TaxID=2737536 RepID=UPI0039E5F5C7